MKKFAVLIICLLIALPLYADWDKVDGIFGIFQSSDSSGTVIDPATEDKQDDIITELQTFTAVDATNSTATPLLGTASAPADTFTGTSTDTLGYSSGIISVLTDQDSLTDGLSIEYSSDGTNWDHTHTYTISANESRGIEFSLEARYLRIVYTNGAAAQSTFRFQTLLRKSENSPHMHAAEYVIDGTHPATIGRSILTAKRADNTYANIRSTNGDNLKISLEELESGISSNSNSQLNVTPFDSSGNELFNTAATRGYVQATDGADVAEITINADRNTDLDGLTGINVNAMSFGRVDDDTVKNVRLDASTEANISISYEHHECHAGTCYSAHYGNDVTNIGEMTCIGFNVPDTTKWPHMVIHGSATQVATFSLYEATSIDADEGTDLTIFNRNRNMPMASTLLSIEGTPVAGNLTSYNEVQAAGANITMTTELYHEQIGSAGSIQTKSGGEARGQAEFILDQAGQYAICINATSADDNHHNIILNWYEHTDRN